MQTITDLEYELKDLKRRYNAGDRALNSGHLGYIGSSFMLEQQLRLGDEMRACEEKLCLRKSILKKDTSVIPYGYTCEDCPYWDLNEDYPEQENGYCGYLEKGDWELHFEGEIREGDKDEKVLTLEEKEALPFCFSMLWDGCKECGINIYNDSD